MDETVALRTGDDIVEGTTTLRMSLPEPASAWTAAGGVATLDALTAIESTRLGPKRITVIATMAIQATLPAF